MAFFVPETEVSSAVEIRGRIANGRRKFMAASFDVSTVQRKLFLLQVVRVV